MDVVKELNEYLRTIAPEAVIRNGDYPTRRGVLDLVLILSQLGDITKVSDYYSLAPALAKEIRKKEGAPTKSSLTEEASRDIPTL